MNVMKMDGWMDGWMERKTEPLGKRKMAAVIETLSDPGESKL